MRDGLLDTGSDDTVFSEQVARNIGIDLSQTVAQPIGLAGRGLIPCRYATVVLRITDGSLETYEWAATVGFVTVPLHIALLGHAGFLQFFDADFLGADREVTLTPNRAFTGKRI